MDTLRLFQNNRYLKETEATVLEAKAAEGMNCFNLVLDQTLFFPTGGGQSCDRGEINGFPVIDVREEGGTISHTVQCPDSNIVFYRGDTVNCTLNWEHRFLNMQRHCGEHILSGIFYREYGGVNRGFHMGDDYMTIDISLEEKPEFSELGWEMAVRAEWLANQVIWSNAPVTVRHYDKRSDAEGLPLRKALAIDGDISIVCVGDIGNPADCVACCGTHPDTAGQVGLIKILKVENYKGMFRVYCEAGSKALGLFSKYQSIVSALNSKYSASADDLLDKMAAQEEKTKAAKNQLHKLKQMMIEEKTETLRRELQEAGAGTPQLPVFAKEFEGLDVDSLLNIGRPLIPDLSRLLILISRSDKIALLFSDGRYNCGNLVKENAPIYQGKGGGNATSARAMFPKAESLDVFVDLLGKHLR